ncbi:MAG: hypothetical protein GY870_11765, partial [archaeon]|nr:hypothetical protein [archaeon]
NIIIPNVRIRKKFKAEMFKSAFMSPNVFGLVAMKTAYNEGENWLNQVLIYIEDNYTFMKKYLEENLPGVKVINNEGTYLIWVNFRVFGLSAKKLEEVFIKEAKIELDHGWMFGEDGDGFERFNIACPRATLKEALKRVVKAFTPYLK